MDIFGVPLPAMLSQFLLGLVNGSFYAILSLGLAVIFGLLNVINFAHGALFMLGAMLAWMGLSYFGLPYWVMLVLAPLIVGLFGMAIERSMLRWLYKLDHLYGLLLTFGLTLVVEASNRVPLKVTANTGKVALRWPKHPVVEQLIDEFGGPITGTSANISGFPACANTDQLMKQLGLRLPLVLDSGETGAGLPSTIIGIQDENWEVLREGAIPLNEIQSVLQ